MIKFLLALDIILKLEGGSKLVNDPRDPGGLTKYGISFRAHSYLGINGITNLTKNQAAKIYHSSYWKKVKASGMPLDLAICVFDCAVNQGPITARILLQDALGVKTDGALGNKTMQALNKSNTQEVLSIFMHKRMLRYLKNENFDIYGAGWSKRLFKVCHASSIAKALHSGLY